MRPKVLLFLATLVLLAAGRAMATDTLAKVRSTRSITLGVHEASVPFSFVRNGQVVGYTVELCLAAVEEIRKELRLPELKVQYHLLTASQRIPSLLDEQVDLECGSTTNTKARLEKVDFSYTVFVASMRVLTPPGVDVESLADLRGRAVALSRGTTCEGAGSRWRLSRMRLSVEPYAIMMRRREPALRALVDRALARLYLSGDIEAVYARWFHTPALEIETSRMTRDSFLRPNREAGVAMVLGYSL